MGAVRLSVGRCDMAAYERFATFYDEVMDDPAERAQRVDEAIARFRPEPATLLELGCGTGSILARLTCGADLFGLDRSPEMLSVARTKVPGARLVEGDMADFALGRTFDVVACVFDSINHLLDLASWDRLFECVHDHLVPDGLFVFDVNTIGELHRLGEDPPFVHDFERGTAVIDVSYAVDAGGLGHSEWEIRIFEHVAAGRYELHREVIGELGVPLDVLGSLLNERFDLLELLDEDGLVATDDSIKAYGVARPRP